MPGLEKWASFCCVVSHLSLVLVHPSLSSLPRARALPLLSHARVLASFARVPRVCVRRAAARRTHTKNTPPFPRALRTPAAMSTPTPPPPSPATFLLAVHCKKPDPIDLKSPSPGTLRLPFLRPRWQTWATI